MRTDSSFQPDESCLALTIAPFDLAGRTLSPLVRAADERIRAMASTDR
jgi:hypothetical protein